MNGSPRRPSFEAVLVFAYAVAAAACEGAIATLDPESGERFHLLVTLGLVSVLATWWVRDRRRLGMWAGIDAGLFCAMAWMVVLPYHLIRTRRWGGVGILAAFVAMYWGSYILASVGTYVWYSR